jgi:hypothetical protein
MLIEMFSVYVIQFEIHPAHPLPTSLHAQTQIHNPAMLLKFFKKNIHFSTQNLTYCN